MKRLSLAMRTAVECARAFIEGLKRGRAEAEAEQAEVAFMTAIAEAMSPGLDREQQSLLRKRIRDITRSRRNA